MTDLGRSAASLCDKFVEHPTDPWGGCSCKLPAEHDGPCSAHYPLAQSSEQSSEHTPRGRSETFYGPPGRWVPDPAFGGNIGHYEPPPEPLTKG